MEKDDLEEAIKELLPNFEFGTDRHGQLIIYTGLIENEDGELVDIDAEDDEDLNGQDLELDDEED